MHLNNPAKWDLVCSFLIIFYFSQSFVYEKIKFETHLRDFEIFWKMSVTALTFVKIDLSS